MERNVEQMLCIKWLYLSQVWNCYLGSDLPKFKAVGSFHYTRQANLE